MKQSLIFILLLLLTSCLPRQEVTVASYLVDENNVKNVYIKSGYEISTGNQKKIDPSYFTYQIYRGYISNALKYKGYNVVDNIKDADGMILLSYGTNTNKKDVVKPIYGQTGYSGSTYNTTCSQGYYGSNTINCSGTQSLNPTYGVVGYRNVTEYSHRKTIFIKLYKGIEEKSSNLIWESTIYSVDDQNNLDKVFPYMVSGSLRYWDDNSYGSKTFYVWKSDDLLKVVKKSRIK